MSGPALRRLRSPEEIRELRLFGILLAFVVLLWTVVAGCSGSWPSCADHLRDLTSEPSRERLLLVALLTISGTCLLLAVLAPLALTPVHRFAGFVGRFLHRGVSGIALGVLFFLAITPMGVAWRALRKDPLRLRWNASVRSYWLDRNDTVPARDRFRDPF